MKIIEKDNSDISNQSLTAEEKEHMKLVQESIDRGVYIELPPKEETFRRILKSLAKKNL